MLHGQLRHLSGPDEQGALALQGAEDFAPQFDRGIADRDGAVADAGFRTDALGDKKGLMEQPVEDNPGRFLFRGDAVSLFDLAEDLGFAQHHGIQAGRYPEYVLDGLVAPVQVERFFKPVCRYVFKLSQKLFGLCQGLVRVLGGKYHFHPITGRKQDHLGNSGLRPKCLQGGIDLVVRKCQALAQIYVRGFMVEAKYEYFSHASLLSKA